jgi:SPP1 family predicted phage head-tail adaptor
MRAGDLRHRVIIQKRAAPQTQNSAGEITTAWSTVATVWAAVEPQSGTESLEQDARVAQVSHLVRIRRRTDVTPAMRAVEGSHTYEILAVLDANKPEQMRLQCREVVS